MKHNERIANNMERTMKQAMAALGYTMEAYYNFKEWSGLEYLRLVLPGDVWMQEQMAKERAYWGWWKVMWYARERDFLTMMEDRSHNIHQARWRYRCMNAPHHLADCRTEMGKRMEESYGREFITQLIKEKTNGGIDNDKG